MKVRELIELLQAVDNQEVEVKILHKDVDGYPKFTTGIDLDIEHISVPVARDRFITEEINLSTTYGNL